MQKKILASILILMLMIFQVDYHKQQAKAVLPAIVPISYVATAMVACGAVGYFTKDINGNWYGNLYDSAKAHYDAMTSEMKNDLNMALAVGSYVTMSAVPNLWDFLQNRFAQDTLIPQVDGMTEFTGGLIYDSSSVSPMQSTGAVWYFTGYSSSSIRFTPVVTSTGLNGSTKAKTLTQNTLYAIISSAGMWQVIEHDTGEPVSTLSWDSTQYSGIKVWDSATLTRFHFSYPTEVGIEYPPMETPINPPLNPADLSQATVSSTWVDRNGVITGPIPTPEQQVETDEQTAIKQAAAAAAAAAYAAAIAAGLSPSAAMQAAIDAAIAAGASIVDAPVIAKAQADIYADTAVLDYAAPITTSITTPLQLDFFTNTMERLNNFDTTKGTAPKITIPLNRMVNCFTPITGISNPFPQEDYTIVDFAYFDTITYMELSLIDYFRMIIGFGFIINTFMYCYRRIYSGSVIH